MPITFAHPAIVLPLLKKRFRLFSATGLVVGTVIPDFESFIRISEHKLYSHTWAGMFWFDLPLAIIVAFIFHNIVRDPLISNLPDFLEDKCKHYLGFRWNAYFFQHFFKIIFSMLIGIALHLLWDAFTHLNLANPDATDSTAHIGPFLLFKVLQNCDSILGIIIVVAYIFYLPPPAIPEDKPIQKKMILIIEKMPVKKSMAKYWALLCTAEVTTIIIILSTIRKHVTLVLLIDINITGLLIGLIVAGILCRKKAY